MRRIRVLAWSCIALLGLAVACGSDTEDGAVHILTADGTVGPIMERYIDRGITRAENNDARLVVIQLDTPGGLSSSMRDIVQRINRSNVPVAVYVSPSGGRAASAGTFITMAGHIAAMAPNTAIGAAAAVSAGGGDLDETLAKKVEEDAVAFIRGIAELRGRNADWAEQAVREAVAVNENEAVRLEVVDFVANDLDDLLRQSEGRTLMLKPTITVEITGVAAAPRVETKMTGWERFLEIIADPNIASILIALGFLGLVFELANPGMILPGVAGVVALILGFLGFGILPVETVGLILIALALILFALEIFVPSGGILGAGGVVALILGGIIAFRDTPSEFQPSRILLIILGTFIVAMFVSLAVGIARVRKRVVATGTQAMFGRLAIARTPLSPEGYVFYQGERWQAMIEEGAAEAGDRVRIVGAEGLRLKVRKEDTP
jgi:membrane-bound serine protease (ClpP class)